jgi:hypothetical protein
MARVLGISDDTLAISRHRSANKGLRFDHAPGTPVELLQAATYRCIPDPGEYPHLPVLVRQVQTGSPQDLLDIILSPNIVDLQVTRSMDGHSIDITLGGRSPVRDPFHNDVAHGDTYHHLDLHSRAYLLNTF